MGRKAKAAPQTRDIASIVNNSSDKAKLKTFIDQAVSYHAKVAILNEDIKAVREDAVETLNIDPKLFAQIVRVYRTEGFDKTLEEMSELEIAIEMLGGATPQEQP